jgi:hypothetical protein
MSATLTTLGAVVLGFLLGLVPPWLARRRKLKTHWHAIRAELERCKEKAEIFLKDRVAAPLYRLPVSAFNTSFPILLSEGALTESESLTIGRCFDLIEDINRGLGYASEMDKLGLAGQNARDQQYNRNCLKARQLLGDDDKPSLYAAAKAIVAAKIKHG